MAELVLADTLSGGEIGLNFALSDLLIAEFNGRQMIFAVSRSGVAIAALEVTDTGDLVPQDTFALTGFPQAGLDAELALLDDDLLIVSGFFGGSGSGVTIEADQSFGTQVALDGAGAFASPTGADGILFAGSAGQGAVQLFDRTSTFGLTEIGRVDDTATLYLADSSASGQLALDGTTWYLSASAQEDGLTLLSGGAAGLQARAAIGGSEGLPIADPSDLATVVQNGRGWVALASSGTSSISLLEVMTDGTLRLRDHILDNGETRFQRATTVELLAVGDLLFLAAAGTDGGVSLFLSLPEGRLVHLDTVVGSSVVSDLTLFEQGGAISIVASGESSAGLVRYTYDLGTLGFSDPMGGDGADILIGDPANDTLSGGAGDDILAGGGGADVLTGGVGADLFVLTESGAASRVTDFSVSEDRLDLSDWGGLSSVLQLTVTSTNDGAELRFDDQRLIVESADGGSLQASDFTTETILNLDRPVLIPLAQDLTGTIGADTLIGGGGFDTIRGGGGDDLLDGGGRDDDIDGGAGADTIQGAGGEDTLIGGVGSDQIFGGAGGDLIYGDGFEFG